MPTTGALLAAGLQDAGEIKALAQLEHEVHCAWPSEISLCSFGKGQQELDE